MATQPAHPDPTTAAAPKPPAGDSFDDMHDSPREWEQYSQILPLAACSDITKAFDEVDTKALWFQKWHRGITFVVAYTATAAVVAAIVGLWYLSRDSRQPAASHPGAQVPQGSAPLAEPQAAESPASNASTRGREVAEGAFNYVEVTTAGLTLLMVGFGTLVGFKRKWMIYRHKAELYRLLRYRFLIQPAVWRAGKDPKPWIQSRMSEIAGISGNKDLEEAVKQPSPHGPFEGTQCRLPARTIYALTQYYLAKRLSPQRDYLADRAHRNELKDRLRRYLPAFFFSSIVAVFVK
ncbi:MAG TPA: hypothetical protein VH744_01570, partial [Terriglobales bacterium]